MIITSPKKRRFFKRFMPQTLFGRSLLILITPIFLIQIISTYVFFDRHWIKMTGRLAFAVSGEIAMMVDDIERRKGDDAAILQIIEDSAHYLDMLVSYDPEQVLDVDLLNSKHFVGWEAMIQRTLREKLLLVIDKPVTVDVDFQEKWIEVRVQMEGGVLNISLPQRRLFSSTSYIFLLWVFGASIILLAISVLFMRNQVRPIRRLAMAAERFGKGRGVTHFKVEGAQEVRLAGHAFLDMKTRIQRQISQRTDMLAGVSHDLRTPLTRLKLQIAMLGDSPDIYDMKKDVSEMESMIDGYLNFVRGEGGEVSKQIDIVALLREITILSKRQGCDVVLNVEDTDHAPCISLRQNAFKRCLSNIVSNAAKYADSVWITLRQTKAGDVEIVIEDNGVGIAPELYEDVFRPFYRVDSSRNMNTGGVGLGLPIAMDIVHAHGGEIWLDKSAHGGLSVHISLPV